MRTISNIEVKLVAGGYDNSKYQDWAYAGAAIGTALGAGVLVAHMGAYGTISPRFDSAFEALLFNSTLGFALGLIGGAAAGGVAQSIHENHVAHHHHHKKV